jgi:hypothetical protein
VARPLYSLSFVDTFITGGGGAFIYDVPAGFVAVVRHIDVLFIDSGALASSLMTVYTNGSPVAYWQIPVPFNDTAHWEGGHVGSPGPDIVAAELDGDPALSCTINVSGFLLSLP